MKTSPSTRQLSRAALAALFIALATNLTRADTNYISRFDSASEVTPWFFDFGSVTHTNSFDPTQDGNTNASSGAMKVVFGFNTNYSGNNKGAYTVPINPPVNNNDVLNLDSIHMDVKVDPASATDAFGLNGYLQVVFRTGPGWTWTPQFGDNIGANYQVDENGWRHFDQTISVTSTDSVHHATFQLYGGPSQNINGNLTLWIDNFYYTTFTTTTSAPPVMTIARAIPGLNINATVVGGTYQRQDIRTSSGNYSWINPSNGPVTYSFTVTNFPSGPAPGFEAHLLLVGNNPSPGNFADYNEANVIYLRLYNAGDHYNVQLYYKVNTDHSSIFSGTYLGGVSVPSPLGTWGLTLAGTNVTVFGPPGSLSTNLGSEVLTAFDAYTFPYIGIIPNDDANVGQSVTFSAVSISGATTALDEHFATFPGTTWVTSVAQDASGVLLYPPTTFVKISWPPPNSPIYSVHATNVLAAAPSWPASGLTINTVGTNKVVLLPNPTSNPKFFRLESP